MPYFNGLSSYISYPTISNAFAVTTLRIEFRPLSSNGLILYNGQQSGPDYIALVLRNGYVEFWYDLGQGPARIVSSNELTLGVWHTVEATRTGQNGLIIVDNLVPMEGTSVGTFSGLQVDTNLFVGGVPYYTNLPSELDIRDGLNGCIRELSVQVDNPPVMLITDAIDGADIGQCPGLRPCDMYECQNGGLCVETSDDSFICNCPTEYSGVLCEIQLCTVSNPCQNNGLCSINVAAEQTCTCSLPYGGQNCTESKRSILNQPITTYALLHQRFNIQVT